MKNKFWIGRFAEQMFGPYEGVIAGGNIIADAMTVRPGKGELIAVDLHGAAECWFAIVAVVEVEESPGSRYFQLRIKKLTEDPAVGFDAPPLNNEAFDLGSRIAKKAGFAITDLAAAFSASDAGIIPGLSNGSRLGIVEALRELECRIRNSEDEQSERHKALQTLAELLQNPIVANIMSVEIDPKP